MNTFKRRLALKKKIPIASEDIPEAHTNTRPVLIPYDVLVLIFKHLSTLLEVQNLFEYSAGNLASAYIELPISPLSDRFLGHAKTHLKSCALVSHLWREAALPVLEDAVHFFSAKRSATTLFRPEKVRACKWHYTLWVARYLEETAKAAAVSNKRKRFRLSSLFRRTSLSPIPLVEQPLPIKVPVSLGTFVNLQVLYLSAHVMEELQELSRSPCPLAGLEHLRTLILCNYDAVDWGPQPRSGRALLFMEEVVYWVRGSHITSLELFDPIIAPANIPDTVTADDFPPSLTSLLLFSHTTHTASSFAKLMKCLPNLRSLILSPTTNPSYDYAIGPCVLPELDTLTLIGCSFDCTTLCGRAGSIRFTRLRCLSGHVDMNRRLPAYPTIEDFKSCYPKMHCIGEKFLAGALPGLETVRLQVVELPDQEHQHLAEQAQREFREECESHGIKVQIKQMKHWQSANGPNLLCEYLTVLRRERSDWPA